jgi:hypothetical protein
MLTLPELVSLVIYQPWNCYIEGLKETGAEHQTSYHVELWNMEWVRCTYSKELLKDGMYITCNMNCWFPLVDKMEKKRMKKRIRGVWCLWLGHDEMPINTYIRMEGEEIIGLELSIDELLDATLGISYAQGFDLNFDLYLVDVDI